MSDRFGFSPAHSGSVSGSGRRATPGDKIAEGDLIFGQLKIRCSLHCRGETYWLTFPRHVEFRRLQRAPPLDRGPGGAA